MNSSLMFSLLLYAAGFLVFFQRSWRVSGWSLARYYQQRQPKSQPPSSCTRQTQSFLPSTAPQQSTRCCRQIASCSFRISFPLSMVHNDEAGGKSLEGSRSLGLEGDVSSLLYREQENLLIRRGQLEGKLMSQIPPTPLQAPSLKGVGKGRGGGGGGGGFGGGGGGGSKSASAKKTTSTITTTATITKAGQQVWKAQAKVQAKVLKEEGVVRIDRVLSDTTADRLRSFLYDMRAESETLVRTGQVPSMDRFADVLLKTNRCDMPIPLGSDLVVANALAEVLLTSPVGHVISLLLGDAAVLYEFSCLMSDPGSQRQVVHPDNPCHEQQSDNTTNEPILYTCFIALQDITWDMGPTSWLPRTHTKEMHAIFQNNDLEKGKDWLLQNHPSVVGILPKGSCAIFDSRTLHCGGANESNTSRALFYFSFKNPNIGYPGNPASIRQELTGPNQLTLKEMKEDLLRHVQGKPTLRVNAAAVDE
ncbi:hypothetical protein ACA910_013344 [Epithemia clementina (nom. ined.)]